MDIPINWFRHKKAHQQTLERAAGYYFFKKNTEKFWRVKSRKQPAKKFSPAFTFMYYVRSPLTAESAPFLPSPSCFHLCAHSLRTRDGFKPTFVELEPNRTSGVELERSQIESSYQTFDINRVGNESLMLMLNVKFQWFFFGNLSFSKKQMFLQLLIKLVFICQNFKFTNFFFELWTSSKFYFMVQKLELLSWN